MPDVPPELVEAFRRLGVWRPECWASSQVNEGIPQLARASLLYWLWDGIVSQRDTRGSMRVAGGTVTVFSFESIIRGYVSLHRAWRCGRHSTVMT
jgi:hypothetical protein